MYVKDLVLCLAHGRGPINCCYYYHYLRRCYYCYYIIIFITTMTITVIDITVIKHIPSVEEWLGGSYGRIHG